MLHFLESTGTTTTGTGPDMMSTILMLVVMLGIFYFMLIRPEHMRK